MPNKKETIDIKNPDRSLSDDMRSILSEGKVTTQEGICNALETLGHTVNQSKVSRLLRKLGAVKSKNEQGQVVYRLPFEPAPPTTSDQLSSLIIDVVANEVTIIVYTSPGAAQLVARILDYHKKKIQILATIAGDDAVFIAPKSIKKIETSINGIKKLLLL